MNPLNINHIKVEKANAIKLRYQKIRKVTNFFRVFEVLLVFAVISRVTFELPLALIKLSNEYFHNITLFLGSPRFVFIIGNVIVVTLFVNSGRFNTPCNVKSPKMSLRSQKSSKLEQKKQGSTEENTIMATIFSTPEHQVIKIYHRSKSEKLKREKMEKSCCSLRRSNTEIRKVKGGSGCCKEVKEVHYPEDHMSSEEFKRTIEDFIAKQQRFLREEEELSAL